MQKLMKKLRFINDLFLGFFLIRTLTIQFSKNNDIIIINGIGIFQN